MSAQFLRGSEWRVWDLHIRSPSSIVQSYGGDKADVWEQFLSALEDLPEEVKVIGLNDYYFIDGYERVMREKLKNGRLANILKVFPVLEFRIDTFGAASASSLSKVNLHVLFELDEDALSDEIKRVKEEFIGQVNVSKHHNTTPLSRENLIAKSSTRKLHAGFSQLIPNTERVFELLESSTWKGKTVVFLGFNEWHTLDVGKQLQPFKQHLYERADFFLTASLADCTSRKEDVLSIFGDRQLIYSLDIHDFDGFRQYKCRTWIKADPTFDGLRHVRVEPGNRLFIGDTPRKKVAVERERHLFIDSLSIKSASDDAEWFDRTGTVYLNPGLNVIIGNKGMGKSALTDIIGLTGNCHKGKYSFLNPTKFLALGTHRKYSATITFRDNFSNTCLLEGAQPDLQKESKVVYLSQSFVDDLCDNVAGVRELQAEIDRVIFSHVPQEHRLAQNDLAALISVRAKEHTDRHAHLCKEMAATNAEIVRMEDMLTDTYRNKMANCLGERKRQLAEVIANEEPPEVSDPGDAASRRITVLSTKYNGILQRLQSESEAIQTQLNANEISMQNVREILAHLDSIVRDCQRLAEKIRREPSLKGVDSESIISLQTDKAPLLAATKALEASSELLRNRKQKCGSLCGKINAFLSRQKESLSDQQKAYQDYVTAKQAWLTKQQALTGGRDTDGTIASIEEHIKQLDTVYPARLKELHQQRAKLASRIVENISEREKGLSDIYSFVQAEADELARAYAIPMNEFLVFDTRTSVQPSFADDFLEFINQNRTGTFYRRDDGKATLERLLGSALSAEPYDIARIPEVLVQALRHNLAVDPDMSDPNSATSIDKQVSGKKTKLALYNFLYSFDHLQSRFTFTYDSKPLHRLSPGERGILLLIFFLLVDKSRAPIVIDQPEGNLDNETVYQRLVRFIKNRKEHRQIIVVTHNPNLAVVCDAEEVISCRMDKMNGNQISYTTGSIENPVLKDAILRVLEGTRPAFDNRQAKYDI